MKKSSFLFSFLCGLLFLITGCQKLVRVEPPVDQLTTAAVFSSDEAATAAVRGIYSEIMKINNYIGNGAMTLYPGLSADEITRTTTNPAEEAFQQNAVPVNSFALQNNLWQKGYFHIYQANAVIENLARSTGLTESLRRQLLGEARFLRAFFYFYLVNLFGPVPLVTTTDYGANAVVARADTTAVYGQILFDLREAQGLLTPAYPAADRTRVNRFAATALLARVLLYLRDWPGAEAAATEVITSGVYRLSPVAGAFLPASTETILQFLPAQTQIFNSSEGFTFIPSSAAVRPNYVLTPSLLAGFEAGDARKGGWVKTVTVSGTTYNYPFKYKVRSTPSGTAKAENNVVLRLAELYLIRAEARAQQGDVPGAQADLNVVRTRAGLGPTPALDRASLLLAIEGERRVEYFAEWGHRWLDLKRTGRADAVLAPLKGANWQPTDVRYPVPLSELQLNPSLTQNPGY